MILTCQCIHAWEVIYTLVRLHAVELIDLHGAISPENVPLVVRIRVVGHVGGARKAHLENCTCRIPHNVILRLRHI